MKSIASLSDWGSILKSTGWFKASSIRDSFFECSMTSELKGCLIDGRSDETNEGKGRVDDIFATGFSTLVLSVLDFSAVDFAEPSWATAGCGPRAARLSGQNANAINNPAVNAPTEPSDRRMRNLLRFRRAMVVK